MQKAMLMFRIHFAKGNPDVHVILRGGSHGPNYAAEYVRSCGEKLAKAGFAQKIMVGLTSQLHPHVSHSPRGADYLTAD